MWPWQECRHDDHFRNYFQHADATLEIELGGTIRGNEYDVLVVDGNLTLDGNLNVLAIGGFEPQAGDIFDILDLDFESGTLSGTFSPVLLPDLPGMLGWGSSHLYSSGTLSVIPEPATLPLLALGMLLAWRRR